MQTTSFYARLLHGCRADRLKRHCISAADRLEAAARTFDAAFGARWRSGDAPDCKSVYAGSIPARASTQFVARSQQRFSGLNAAFFRGYQAPVPQLYRL